MSDIKTLKENLIYANTIVKCKRQWEKKKNEKVKKEVTGDLQEC